MKLKTFIYIYILQEHIFESIAINALKFRTSNTELQTLLFITKHCVSPTITNNIIIGDLKSEENLRLKFNSFPTLRVDIVSETFFKNHKRYFELLKVNETVLSKSPSPVTDVIIIVSSATNFSAVLNNFRKSIWWNNDAFFKIYYISKNSCQLKLKFLNIIWSLNVLTVLFFCLNLENKLILYTFNPFASLAPNFWRMDKNSSGIPNNQWTLFEHKVESYKFYNSSLCRYINFDKTKELNQYAIRSIAWSGYIQLNKKKKADKIETYEGAIFDQVRIILNYLNATTTLKISSTFGFLNDFDEPEGFLKDLVSGEANFVTITIFIRDYWKIYTYPHSSNGLCIVSSKVFVSYLHRFLTIFTPQVWIFLVAMCLVSILTLKYLLNKSIVYSVLMFFRMFTMNTTMREPKSSPGKIIFLDLLLFNFMFNILTMSYLSSVATVPEHEPVIDSAKDLINSKLKIYGTGSHKTLIYHPEILHRYHIEDFSLCSKRLLRGEQVACISHCLENDMYKFENNNFHISKKRLVERPEGILTSVDWVLLPKVNWIIWRLNEAGIDQLLEKREIGLYYTNHNSTDNTDITTIKLEHLMFNFVLLLCGCLSGVISFIFEIYFHTPRVNSTE